MNQSGVVVFQVPVPPPPGVTPSGLHCKSAALAPTLHPSPKATAAVPSKRRRAVFASTAQRTADGATPTTIHPGPRTPAGVRLLFDTKRFSPVLSVARAFAISAMFHGRQPANGAHSPGISKYYILFAMLIVRSTKGRPNKFDLVQICYIDDFAIGSLARLLAQLPQPPVRGHDLRRWLARRR